MEQYKGIAFEQEDIKSLEKVEGRQFSNPINLRDLVPLTKANKESKSNLINRKDLKLFDKNNIDRGSTNVEVVEIPHSFYDELLKELPFYERVEEPLEALPRRYPQHIEELVDELPYEDLVRLTYRSLEKHGKTPIDFTYDLLNEMARELYQIAINKYSAEREDFRINFKDKENFPKQLRKLRKSLGVRMLQLSKYASISQSFISEIENGKYNPSITSLLQYFYSLKRIVSKRRF